MVKPDFYKLMYILHVAAAVGIHRLKSMLTINHET